MMNIDIKRIVRIAGVTAGVLLVLFGLVMWLVGPLRRIAFAPTASEDEIVASPLPTPTSLPTAADATSSADSEESAPAVTVLAENLEIPWGIDWLPDGSMLVTERPGRLLHITNDRTVIPVSGVRHVGEGGLLGVAVHPQFATNSWVYLYLTTQSGAGLINRVERYEFADNVLSNRTVILDGIPGAQFHDGGQLAFGPASAKASAGKPDYFLYITTGDAGNEDAAQETTSLAGKILRVTDNGEIPADNPFDNEVYSYGHRNPQGLTWDDRGQLWATEHGRSGIRSGFDELNMIEAGANYGWPVIQGDETNADMRAPTVHSGASTTWAPASAAYHDGSIFFGGLRGEALYEAVIGSDGQSIERVIAHAKSQFGRIRAVKIGPDDLLYITTSNRDGRGAVQTGDDKLIRIDLARL